MSHPCDINDPAEVSTGAEVLARLMYVVLLTLVVAVAALVAVGVVISDWRCLLSAVTAAALAALTRNWLLRDGRMESASRALDAAPSDEEAVSMPPLERLIALLREWDDLERARGSDDFDPRTLRRLRREIQGLVERNPPLNRLFHL